MAVKHVFLLVGALGATAWTEAGVSALQGVVVDDQYILHAPIEGSHFEIPGGLVEVEVNEQGEQQQEELQRLVRSNQQQEAGDVHGVFPMVEYAHPKYLRSGSFGEAWEAYDGGVKVVLKLFYRKSRSGRITYLTRDNLERHEGGAVTEAVQECKLAQNMVTLGPRDDPGRNRFVNCRRDMVTGRRGTQPLYLVLDHGGRSIEEWIRRGASAASTLEKRKVVGMLLQGLRTMGELLPKKLVHHDLKPANAVYDGANARLIDFGGTMEGSRANMRASAVATPAYSPPEFQGLVPGQSKKAFDMPAVSYDVYALGMIYAEIMCAGKVSFMDIMSFATSSYKSESSLKRIFDRRGCVVSTTDMKLMVKMMAFYARDRPLPSQILDTDPFNRPEMEEVLEEGQENLLASESGGDDLLASIVPKDEKNPNVRGGRAGLFDFGADADKAGWQDGKRCEHRSSIALMKTRDFASMSGTRGQCEAKCIEFEAAHRERIFAAMQGDGQNNYFCCELNVLGADATGRSCEWGYGTVIEHVAQSDWGNAYARFLPFTAAPREPAAVAEVERPAPRTPEPGAQSPLQIKDRVRVKMPYDKQWKKGRVTQVHPVVKVLVDGWDRDFEWDRLEKLDRSPVPEVPLAHEPVVREPAGAFQIGQRVRVRDYTWENWESGVVERLSSVDGSPYVLVDAGWARYGEMKYNYVEDAGRGGGHAPKFRVDQFVQMRWGSSDPWLYGIVTSVVGNVVKTRQNGIPSSYSYEQTEAFDPNVNDVVMYRNYNRYRGDYGDWYKATVSSKTPLTIRDSVTRQRVVLTKDHEVAPWNGRAY